MSLLLLLKPNGVAVQPPAPPAAPSVGQGTKRRIPPRRIHRFPAGVARILVRPFLAHSILIPGNARARVLIHARSAPMQARFSAPLTKQPVHYRAAEVVDEKFNELVKTAFLLTR